MNNIFKFMKWSLAVVLISGLSFSCVNDLDDLPADPNIIVSDDVFGSELEGYTRFLSKLYAGLAVSGPSGAGSSDIQGIDAGFGQYLRAYYMMQEVPTDEAILAWTGDAGVIDMGAATFNANNPFINAMYVRIMYQIGVCNEFLRQTSSENLSSRGVSAEDQATIQQYRAEARFLRALSYWHGMDLFGKMSFVVESDPVDPGFLPPEISRANLYEYVVQELQSCSQDMGAPLSLPYGRADQAAAWMLLAKVYLNAEVYTGTPAYGQALTTVEQVIGSGYIIADVPYQNLFLADNHSNGAQNEFIFAVQSDGNNLQSYGSTTFIAHASVGGSMEAADYGLDFGWGGLRARPEFVQKFDDDDGRAIFYTEGQELNIASMGTFTDGYGVNKYQNLTSTGAAGSNPTFVDIDFPMFRLADAYLMYAECVARGAGGSSTTALGYINELRNRVSAAPMTTLTVESVIDERARELYWECHRRTDLIRAGLFTGGVYNWQWKGFVQSGSSIGSNKAVMPIPESALSTNPNLSQNAGY